MLRSASRIARHASGALAPSILPSAVAAPVHRRQARPAPGVSAFAGPVLDLQARFMGTTPTDGDDGAVQPKRGLLARMAQCVVRPRALL